MTALNINITKRTRARRQRSGALKEQTRYVLNYREPRTGKRTQLFFARHKDALEKRNDIITRYATGTLPSGRTDVTVADALERWMGVKAAQVRERTLRGYREATVYVTRPILTATPRERAVHTMTGEKPDGGRLLPVIGDTKISDLATSDVRAWHQAVAMHVGLYTANRAMMFLRAALDLAEEDWGVRPPKTPKGLGRGRHKVKKAILMPEQVALLLKDAQRDRDRAIYLAFPFLAGTRPSEQLGLLWDSVDFDAGVILIRRTQSDFGELSELTKTEAGRREVPMSPLLRQILLEWRVRCPRRAGELHRVFPAPGLVRAWPKPRIGGGGALSYPNFRKRFWLHGLNRLGLPLVTPHSARHCFISTLQMQGVEIGLVAKLAGHANPAVTLSVYTQATRGGAEAVQALDRAFGG